MEKDTGNHLLFYVHLGASHRKLFEDGYENMRENRISVSTTTASGMTFTATSTKDRDKLVESVRALCNYNDGNINFKLDSSSLKADLNNSISGHLVLSKMFSPSATALTDLSFCDHIFDLSFRHQHATFLMSAAPGPTHYISLAATTGTPSTTFGFKMDAIRMSPMMWLPHWEAAIQATRPTWDAAVFLEFDRFKVSYVRYLDEARKIAAGVMIPVNFVQHKIDFVAGGSCVIDDMTSVKARNDRRAMLEMLLHRRLNDKAHLTVSAEFDINDFNKKPGIGLAVALEL